MFIVAALTARPGRSSDVPWGVSGLADPSLTAETEGVRRCLLRYEAERGRLGRGLESEERRLVFGEAAADDAGDWWEGGV